MPSTTTCTPTTNDVSNAFLMELVAYSLLICCLSFVLCILVVLTTFWKSSRQGNNDGQDGSVRSSTSDDGAEQPAAEDDDEEYMFLTEPADAREAAHRRYYGTMSRTLASEHRVRNERMFFQERPQGRPGLGRQTGASWFTTDLPPRIGRIQDVPPEFYDQVDLVSRGAGEGSD